MNHHIHAAGLTILLVLAITGAAHYLIRTVAAHHADSPWAQGLVYIF